MLGIRHFQGIAIDLWHGKPQHFVCDSLVVVEHPAPAGGPLSPAAPCCTAGSGSGYPAQWLIKVQEPASPSTHPELYAACWQAARGRHLCLPVLAAHPEAGGRQADDKASAAALRALHTAISTGALAPELRRVTFITDADASYASLQEQLFTIFPEAI